MPQGTRDAGRCVMRRAIGALAVLLMSLALGTPASAQETVHSSEEPRPSSPRPVEVEIGAGYLVGLGGTAPPSPTSGAMGAGIDVALGLDYRLDSRWALGIQ